MSVKGYLVWGAGLMLGVGVALAVPQIIAWQQSQRAALEPGRSSASARPAESCEFLLVVARREERSSLNDATPHRNSRVALYEKAAKSGWNRVTEPLPIRSATTAQEPKLSETSGEPIQSVRYGFFPVPLGVFTVKEGVWRDGESPAYLLSDWGRFDGSIALKEPQVIRKLKYSRSEDETSPSVLRTSMKKKGCWIHYTSTERWSHGDSNGCMNLYRPKEHEDQTYPYDTFLSWFEEHDLSPGPEGDLMACAVVPFDQVTAQTGADNLKKHLADGFLERARKLQGYQMGALP